MRFWILLLFPCLSRWGMLLVLEFFSYARTQGIGMPFQPSGARLQLLAGLLVTVAATIALAGPGGLALLAIASVVAVGLASWASRLLRRRNRRRLRGGQRDSGGGGADSGRRTGIRLVQ